MYEPANFLRGLPVFFMDIVGLQYISYITTKEMGVLRVITVTENIQRAINALENSAPVITARCNRDSLLDMQFKRIYAIN